MKHWNDFMFYVIMGSVLLYATGHLSIYKLKRYYLEVMTDQWSPSNLAKNSSKPEVAFKFDIGGAHAINAGFVLLITIILSVTTCSIHTDDIKTSQTITNCRESNEELEAANGELTKSNVELEGKLDKLSRKLVEGAMED